MEGNKQVTIPAPRKPEFIVDDEDGAPLRFIRRFGTGALAGTRVYPPAVPARRSGLTWTSVQS